MNSLKTTINDRKLLALPSKHPRISITIVRFRDVEKLARWLR